MIDWNSVISIGNLEVILLTVICGLLTCNQHIRTRSGFCLAK